MGMDYSRHVSKACTTVEIRSRWVNRSDMTQVSSCALRPAKGHQVVLKYSAFNKNCSWHLADHVSKEVEVSMDTNVPDNEYHKSLLKGKRVISTENTLSL